MWKISRKTYFLLFSVNNLLNQDKLYITVFNIFFNKEYMNLFISGAVKIIKNTGVDIKIYKARV